MADSNASYLLSILLKIKTEGRESLALVSHDLRSLGRDSKQALGGIGRTRSGIRALGSDSRSAQRDVDDLSKTLGNKLMVGGIAIGGAGLAGLKLVKEGIKDSASKEEAMVKLRAAITKLGKDGSVDIATLNNQMAQFESLGDKLGNKLPGNTEMYLDLFATMKQRGLDIKTVLEGAGEAASLLATANDAAPRDIGQSLATFGQLYKLQGQEYVKAADLFSRLYTAKQLDAGELIEASKYFAGRTGAALGLTGIKGAEETTRFLAFMREKTGMEGSQLGTSTSSFFTMLVKHKKELDALSKKTGIKLEIYDEKGSFKGLDNALKQFAQLQGKLSNRDVLAFGDKIAGEQGSAVFQAMVSAGNEWKGFNESLDSTVGLMQKADMLMGTFNAKMDALRGSMTNLNAASFESMLKTLGPVVDKTNTLVGSIQQLIKENPRLATTAVMIFGVGSALATVSGAAMTLAGWFLTLRIGASVFNLIRGGANSSASAIAGTGAQAVGLRDKIKGIPTKWSTTVGLLGVGLVVSELASLAAEFERRKKQFTEDTESSQDSLDTFRENKGRLREQGPSDLFRTDLYKEARRLASEGFKKINADRSLEIALNPQSISDAWKNTFDNVYKPERTWWTPLLPDTPYDKYTAAQRFKQVGKMFEDPDVMRVELTKIARGGYDKTLGKEGAQQYKETLATSFPKAYAEAVTTLAQDLSTLSQSAQPLNTSFSNLDRTTSLFLGPSIMRSSSALDRFAFKLDNFSPSISLPSFFGPTTDNGSPQPKPLKSDRGIGDRPFDSSGFKTSRTSLSYPIEPPIKRNGLEHGSTAQITSLIKLQPQAQSPVLKSSLVPDRSPIVIDPSVTRGSALQASAQSPVTKPFIIPDRRPVVIDPSIARSALAYAAPSRTNVARPGESGPSETHINKRTNINVYATPSMSEAALIDHLKRKIARDEERA